MTGIEILTAPAPTGADWALVLVPAVLGAILLSIPIASSASVMNIPRWARWTAGLGAVALIAFAFWNSPKVQDKLDAQADSWSQTISTLEDAYAITVVERDDVPQTAGSALLVAIDTRTKGALAIAIKNDGQRLSVHDASSDADGAELPQRR